MALPCSTTFTQPDGTRYLLEVWPAWKQLHLSRFERGAWTTLFIKPYSTLALAERAYHKMVREGLPAGVDTLKPAMPTSRRSS